MFYKHKGLQDVKLSLKAKERGYYKFVMSPIRGILFGIRSHFVKQLSAQRFAFLHNTRLRFKEFAIEIKMPSLSPTMTEGTIVKWLKQEGDSISPGDVLCEIQTDKAVVGLEIEEEGVLSKIIIPEDTKNVQLGEVIAVLMAEGDGEIVKESKPTPREEKPEVSRHVEDTFPRLCGPSVKKLLAEYGIKFSDVPNSGPHGNLLKGDVLTFIQDRKMQLIPSPAKKPIQSSENIIVKTKSYDDISISSSRKTTAQQSVLSKTTIPHAYINVDCNIDKVLEYQKRMKQDGFDVALNDFLIKSVASALRKVPEMNVVNLGGHIKALESINLSVTIAEESGYASIILKRADSLTVQLIAEQMKSPTAKLENEITSFRIFNLGLFGVSEFSAIISPPEVAILAVGAVCCAYEDPKVVQKLRMTLSFNNEVISAEVAALFSQYLREHLENPLSVCLA